MPPLFNHKGHVMRSVLEAVGSKWKPDVRVPATPEFGGWQVGDAAIIASSPDWPMTICGHSSEGMLLAEWKNSSGERHERFYSPAMLRVPSAERR